MLLPICSHPRHQTACINLHLKRCCFTAACLPLLATVLLLPILLGLGYWQLQRAAQKRHLIAEYQTRAQATPLTFSQLNQVTSNWQYYPVEITGHYDNQHQFLLDNRTYQHRIGYQVLTPFLPEKSARILLINRGWIAATSNRQQLPNLPAVTDRQTIHGIIYFPNKPFLLSKIPENSQDWPRRIQAIETSSMTTALQQPLYPFVVLLAPEAPNGFIRDWHPTTSSPPAKNVGYAIQWFALALLLVIIFAAVNFHRKQELPSHET